jgi:hopanoid C-3 methylase
MHIALINPPRSPHNGILAHACEEAKQFIHKKLIGPPLGLLTIAANLKDHDVSLLEMKGEYDLIPDSPPPALIVREFLERTKPEIVGVTFIASEFPLGLEILHTVKAFDPDIVTVAGGLHATLCPEHFCDPSVDIVCIGPGAGSFRQIVEAIARHKGFDHIGGILVRRGTELVATTAPIPILDPAGKNFIPPDRTLLERWRSTYRVGKAPGPSTYVFTSLGCPYSCSFCSIWPQFGGRYFQREVESVIEELKGLDGYDVVRFSDANTLVNLDFARRLFDRIEEEGIKKTFIMDIRVDTAADNPELIAKLAAGGLKVVIAGFESIRQDELKRYNKQLQAEQIDKAIKIFHDNGIMLRGNYIIPPSYNDKDFRALADYAARHRVAFAGYTILTPFPGTSFYREAQADIVDQDLAKYNMFNAVTRTTLPLPEFYRKVSDLWLIRKGTDTI